MNKRLARVWDRIDPQRLQQTLMEMIDIYSPSGKEEDIQLYLEEHLSAAGIAVERQEVEEERYNLICRMGKEDPAFYLVGHVDTVTAWDIDDYAAKEEWGVIRGLGAADMKGGCAAMVEAWLALTCLPESERPSVGLLLVVGEEENGDGSARFLEDCQPEWVVIGEPTSMLPAFNHYGYMEIELTTSGRRIHSSLPELGHNAIESMLRVLLLLERMPLFNKEEARLIYSIREMSSSRAGFVVPDRCDAWIDLHLAPSLDPAWVHTEIETVLTGAEKMIPGLALETGFTFEAGGYELEKQNGLLELLEEIYPQLNLPLDFVPFRSHSDGNLFYQAGCRPLILGPGSLETAHTSDEQTSFAEVEAAARVYAALALGFTRLES